MIWQRCQRLAAAALFFQRGSTFSGSAAGFFLFPGGFWLARQKLPVFPRGLLRRVPKVEKVEVPGFFAGGGGLQGEKRKESLVDSEHFRRSQAPFPCRKRRVRRLRDTP